MWLSLDRIEGDTVILIDDNEGLYHVTASAYETLTGLSPRETHMLWCEVRDGVILSARFDPEETDRRTQAARDRLRRLVNKNNDKG